MIKKVTDNINLSGVSSPLLPLIYCDFYYNSRDSEGVYFQYNETNELISVFSLKNGCVTFIRIKDDDFTELSVFFELLRIRDVLSDYPLDDGFKSLPLLEATDFCKKALTAECLTAESGFSEYLDIYNLLYDTDGDFSGWYSIFSKKINSKVACGVYKTSDNSVVSTATATAIYENTAVISGVFTDPAYRGNGYATECVKVLVNKLHKQSVDKIYLWCEEDKLPFYEKLGFNMCGKIYLRKV